MQKSSPIVVQAQHVAALSRCCGVGDGGLSVSDDEDALETERGASW